MEVLKDILAQAGLNNIDANVYDTLIKYGGLTVVELSTKARLKRTNLYNVLNNLQEKGLVKKVEEGKTTKYFPEAPSNVQTLLEQREERLDLAKKTFDILIDDLDSKYKLVSHKPTVIYYEGITGLHKLYKDVLDTASDILLLRSTFDARRLDVNKAVRNQITEQVKRKIHTRVIGPYELDAKDIYKKYDDLRLVEQRFTTNYPLNLPAQILIYGNKTSIATIKKDIMITIIDNKEITDTFKILFEFMWAYLEPEHKELIKDWGKS